MRYSSSLAALAASVSVASASYKGVAPHQLSLYQTTVPNSSPAKWICLNSSQEIQHSAVNDNYCDCEDGSDEPGTGACSKGLFWCANEGHVGVLIRASRVNDGICDFECCDGSDEALGMCPDVCHVVGEEHRRAQEVENKLRRTGAKIRSTYTSFAQKEKVRLEASIQSLSTEVASRKMEVQKLKETWEHAASLDEARLQLRKQSPTFITIQDHVDLLQYFADRHKALQERISTLESVLANLKAGYNPNYQDMAVLEAVRGWDSLKPAGHSTSETPAEGQFEPEQQSSEPVEVRWTEARINDLKRTDPLSVLLEHERHVGAPAQDDIAAALFTFDRYIPDTLMPTYEYLRGSLLDILTRFGVYQSTAIRPGDDSEAKKHNYESAQDKLRSTENKLEEDVAAIEKIFDPEAGFGNKGEWKKLENVCIEKDAGEYTYSLCFFGQATQRSKNGGSNNLGRFSNWNTNGEFKPGQHGYYTQQLYDNGAQCWNGPTRSVKLNLSCGTENALLSIAEPEKCEYLFTGITPALCWTDEELGSDDGSSGRSKEDL